MVTRLTGGEGNGNQLPYSCLENPMDGGAWWAAVPGVSKSRSQLSDFTFPFHVHALEKEMAAHSSVLAWRIPGTGEPGGLPSMGSHRVRHDWSDLAAAAAADLLWWLYKNIQSWEFPAGLSVRIRCPRCLGPGSVLIGELRCHKPHTMVKKEKSDHCCTLETNILLHVTNNLAVYI